MDDTTRARQEQQREARTGTEDAGAPAAQQPLPFDEAADEPIAFRLTARARRQVAPEALPDLQVVEGDASATLPRSVPAPPRMATPAGDLDIPGDTRPSRARALRRAGFATSAIADQLGVDDLIVRAWIGDVTEHPAARRHPLVRGAGRRSVAAGADASPAGAEGSAGGAADQHTRRFALARAEATVQALTRLAADPAFAAGVGLLAGMAVTDEHAVTITTARPDVAARLLGWLVAHAGVQRSLVRVVLRLGADAAGDLARHRWADSLELPLEQVVHTRWRGAPAGEAQEALIRLADAELAAQLAGWCDALLRADAGAPAGDRF